MTESSPTTMIVDSAGPGPTRVNEPARTGMGSLPEPRCFHCGTLCRDTATTSQGHAFCCQGCRAVFELLTGNGLADFYRFGEAAGTRRSTVREADAFAYLDEPPVRARVVDFTDERTTRATLRVPAIHCIACVWLLENLFRLKPGIGRSQVNFPRKEVSIVFDTARVKLSEAVALLTSLGYEPDLKLSDLEGRPGRSPSRRLWLQLGIAGFVFGNVMLFSISSYLGLDSFSGPGFKRLFGRLSLGLSLPVIVYSASDYWRSAWVSLRKRVLVIEVPIAAGIAALFVQSASDVVAGGGVGYFDSLAGLIFFLLCGRVFQQKTYDRLTFDRDYKSFYPLAVTRKKGGLEERVALSQLQVGDRLLIRNGELIPADARLVAGPARIDYSFVTGESEPATSAVGEYLYAGGRQTGGAIEVEAVKPVAQSYLASLWDQETFRKGGRETLETLTNRYSRLFTRAVFGIAVVAAVFWWFRDPDRSLKAFTAVLIVACPCALALAAPFALGTAQRVLARRGIFLKNPGVLEALARLDTVVFDKTGTLTATEAARIAFHGAPLTEPEERWVRAATRHSTHPHAVRIGDATGRPHFPELVTSFLEKPGCGIEASVAGHEIRVGSAAWLTSRDVRVPLAPETSGSVAHVAIDGTYRGHYTIAGALRPGTDQLVGRLSSTFELVLLSGDNEKEREQFRALFGPASRLHFNQSPLAKLEVIRRLQRAGRKVMMIGDGLNDAGALKQADVGVAVVESMSAFSPASDVILAAGMVPRLPEVLQFSRQAVRVVRLSFLISSIYNVVGISIAARGLLSPLVCAVLMPLSSVTVVAFACSVTGRLGARVGPDDPTESEAP
ncbi:MAG: heavy metal translocating P-type ATPase [Limisphaerales bacterium]